ncbi:MAG: hypothetical protein WAU07_04355, partial [Microgenomates group bacterium]
MPSQTAQHAQLKNAAQILKSKLKQTYPELVDVLREDGIEQLTDMVIQKYGSLPLGASTVNQQIETNLSNTRNLAASTAKLITLEEFQVVIEKLSALSQLPPGTPLDETVLYLEQQLSDILGFTVCSHMPNRVLPLISGAIYAEEHIALTREDVDSSPERVKEAPFLNRRPAFGYFNDEIVSGAQNRAYYVGLPLHTVPEWVGSAESIKKSFKGSKVLVINPADLRAVVAIVADIAPTLT